MKNQFKIIESTAVIYLKNIDDNITGEVYIDILDLEKIMEFPNTWRLQKIGNREEVRGTYSVNGVKRQTTLAKWILSFPNKPIYFVDGNTLNNKRENLSFDKPLKGNKITTKGNISFLHISRRKDEDLLVLIDADKVESVKKYTWVCERKSDINDYIIYTRIYDKKKSRKLSLRNFLLGSNGEKTAYFKNGNRMDFRIDNIKLYSEEMTNDYYIENGTAFIFVKVKNEESYVVTMIDEEDLEKVKKLGYTWHYFQGNGEPYAVNTIIDKDGLRKRVYLHRVVNNCPEELVVDHINHDTLDNRKKNLRNVSVFVNQQNRKGANKNSLSGIRNVNWDNTNKDWIVSCGGRYIMRTKDFNEAKLTAIRIRTEMFPFATN